MARGADLCHCSHYCVFRVALVGLSRFGPKCVCVGHTPDPDRLHCHAIWLELVGRADHPVVLRREALSTPLRGRVPSKIQQVVVELDHVVPAILPLCPHHPLYARHTTHPECVFMHRFVSFLTFFFLDIRYISRDATGVPIVI